MAALEADMWKEQTLWHQAAQCQLWLVVSNKIQLFHIQIVVLLQEHSQQAAQSVAILVLHQEVIGIQSEAPAALAVPAAHIAELVIVFALLLAVDIV
jgi:hypothetical protein